MYLRYASSYSHPIFWSTVVKVMLLCPVFFKFTVAGKCTHIHSGLQQNLIFQIYSSWFQSAGNCKIPKICVSQVYLKLFPCNFLLNSVESHVVVTGFTQKYSQWFAAKFSKINFFKFSVAGKCSKCIK